MPAIQKWERQDKEPPMWFARFLLYLELGRGRSINAAYQEYKTREAAKDGESRNVPKSDKPARAWYVNAKKWGWELRATAYDLFQYRNIEGELFDLERQSSRRRRRELLEASLVKLDKLLDQYEPDPDEVRLGEIGAYTKILMHELRVELMDVELEKLTVDTGDKAPPIMIALDDLDKED